jgi:HK97 family phage prohead protease
VSTTVWGTATRVGEVAAHYNRFGDLIDAHSYKSLSLELPGDGVVIDADHDHVDRGRLVYAELGQDDALRCVAVVDADLTGVEEPIYFSGEFELRGDVGKRVYVARQAALLGLSLTFSPATLGARPVGVRAGDVRRSIDRFRWPSSWRWSDPLLGRAVDSLGSGLGVERRSATCITDQRRRSEPVLELASATRPVEHRSAQALDVDVGRRQIEVLAAPYGIEALVPVGGRMVSESFSNTAFASRQPDRIYSTRDHDTRRLIGRVRELQPFHADGDGLHAVIEVSDTPLGRESVQLAKDQVLAASVGFQVPDGGETWEGRSRRRVHKAVLREIALVADPAYPTFVTDVRDRAQLALAR